MQQKHDPIENMKKNFNIGYTLFLFHQRAIIVPMRDKFGSEALGFSCLMAFIMMVLWYVAAHDNLMLLWIGLWLLCFIKRRIQSARLNKQGVRIHSHQGLKELAQALPAFPESVRPVEEPGVFGNPTPQIVTQEMGAGSYQDMLREASQRELPDQGRGMER